MKQRTFSLEWEILFIVLTSLFPIWLFGYHPASDHPFEKQITYHLMSFPFYILHYFLLYCFIIDFVLSAICEGQDSAFCTNNYNGVRYVSLYVAIVILVLTTISQVVDAIYNPRYKKVSANRKKRMDIRKSVENAYFNMLGRGSSVKRKVSKEVNRRMKKFRQGRRSSNAQLNLVTQVELKIEQIKNSTGFEPLKQVYNNIDRIAEESKEDSKRLEDDLYKALSYRIQYTPRNVSYEPLQRTILQVRSLIKRSQLLDWLSLNASRRMV